jgi:NAD+ kinase
MEKEKHVIGIVVNPRKEQIVVPLEILENWQNENLQSRQFDVEFLLCPSGSKYLNNKFKFLKVVSLDELLNSAQMILALGGDGTMLRTVQLVGQREIPIMGINLGGLGFLAETLPEELCAHLENYLKGNYFIEERSLLQCEIPETGESYFAFNDFVIDKAGFSRVIEIVTRVDGCLLNSYIADALIISSPTGSTAYSLSAGGPIMVPETNAFIINPICPHSLTNRPVVVPDTSKIHLDVYTEFKEVKLFRDGQLIDGYPSGTCFDIFKADFRVKLIKMKERSFYDTLRNKLHWGEDFRDKKRWSYKNAH